MDNFENRMNRLLATLYRSAEKLEEGMLRASRNFPLTISEIHLLEAVAGAAGTASAATVSDISEYLDIRLPSATVAVNKLLKKGYVAKTRCPGDGRVVRVTLTREGRRAERAHRYFHWAMARNVAAGLTEAEKTALLRGFAKLNAYLDGNIPKYGL